MRVVGIGFVRVRNRRALDVALFAVAGAATVVARRPQVLLQPEFRVEDGQTFYIGTYFGSPLDQLFRPYQGYLHVVPRLVGFLERAVRVSAAPLIANAAAIAVAVAVAAYITSERLAPVISKPRLGLALAAVVLLLPGAAELQGSITFAPWYVAVFLIAAAVASEPDSRPGKGFELAALATAGLTGPAVLFVAPLHVASAVVARTRWRLATAFCVCAAALVQLGFLVTSTRDPARGGSFIDALDVVAVRGVIEPIFGERLTPTLAPSTALAAAGVVVACLVFAARGLPRSWLMVLAYLWLVSVGAALVGSLDTYADLRQPYVAERYFYLSGLAIAALIAAAIAAKRRPIALALGAMLVVGILKDFRIDPVPVEHWATRSACIGGPVPCRVPIDPVSSWTIHWPGRGGTYNQNRTFEPDLVP
jgi:hypothetical protein